MQKSIAQWLKIAKKTFQPISITSKLDAEVLLAYALDKPKSYLFSHSEALVPETAAKLFASFITQRARGKPVAYITGIQEFWSLPLRVNEHVLIPRAETELVVETVLKLLPPHQPQLIADLGTGCGAIALALARERPQWQFYATDISEAALLLAQMNCKQLNISNVKFFHGDWFEALPSQKFNAILSNPPYIDSKDPDLDPLVKKYEPKTALIASHQGLAAIQHIAAHAQNYLHSGGGLLFEHGSMQRAAVATILIKNGYSDIECIQDYAGHDRVSFGLLK